MDDQSFRSTDGALGAALEALREQNRVLRQVANAPALEAARAAAKIAEDHRRRMDSQIAIALQPHKSALDALMKPSGVFGGWQIPNYTALFKTSTGLDVSYGTKPLLASLRRITLPGLRDIYKPPRPLSLHPFASHGVRAIGALNPADLEQLRNALGLWRGLDNSRAYERLALAFARSSADRLSGNVSSRARAALQWGLRNWGRFLTLLRLAAAGAGFLSAWSVGVVARPRRFGRLASALPHLTFSIQRHGPPLHLA